MRTKNAFLPFGAEQVEREITQPLLDAMDELAGLVWAIQDLEARLAAVRAEMADQKEATKHAKRALQLASAAKLELTRLTQRNVSAQSLQEFRGRHIVALRRAARSARRLAAQEHAATGQRVIEVRVLHTLQEIVARWEAADQTLVPGFVFL